MRTLLTIGAALMLQTPGAAFAAEPDLSFMNLSLERSAGYIEGASAAIAYINMTLTLDGRPPLFCDPKFGPVAADLYDLANTKLTGAHEPMLFIIAALDALVERYPCN